MGEIIRGASESQEHFPNAVWDQVDKLQGDDLVKGKGYLNSLKEALESYQQDIQKGI